MGIDPSKLMLVKYPAPILRKMARPVPAITPEVRGVVARMIRLMHEEEGVGLAAPQVGLGWRLFVANWSRDEVSNRVFINPVLSDASPEAEDYSEGCLSLPGIRADIRRPVRITITAMDLEGKTFTETSSELPARIWQHETDHLDGRLIIDLMTSSAKQGAKRTLKYLEDEFKAGQA